MNNTLRTNNSYINIINFVMILGVFVFLTMGCQQINDAVNSTPATNSNATANSNSNANTNSNANSNVTANSNANANTTGPTNSATNTNNQASNTATNTATAPKEEVPLTPEVKEFKVNLVGEWATTDGTQIWRFDETKLESKFTNANSFSNPLSYRVVDEKTIEFDGSSKATITFEDNGNTLTWVNQGDRRTFKLKRVNPK